MNLRHVSSELRKFTNFIKPLMKAEDLLKELEGFEKRREDLIKAACDIEENITSRKDYLGNIEALITKSAADRSAIIEETSNIVKVEKENLNKKYDEVIETKKGIVRTLTSTIDDLGKKVFSLGEDKLKLEKIIKGLQSIINTTSSNLNKEV